MYCSWLPPLAVCCTLAGCGPATPPAEPAPPVDTEAAPTAPVTAVPVAQSATPEVPKAPHWTYSGEEGPAHWGSLSEQWAACGSGKAQSPIDLPAQPAKAEAKSAVAISYGTLPLQVINNGHTVQVSGAGGGKLTVDGVDYALAQFHLHAPSEHTVGGKPFAMELHLVHKSADGTLAVIGLLFDKGKANAVLEPVLVAAPKSHVDEPVAVKDVALDLTKLVPAKAPMAVYAGSLTTPPCSEGVKWFVVTSPLQVSQAQIDRFVASVPGDSARPVQPLNDRKVVAGRL